MEYLGAVAPFYVSRYRLRILSERATTASGSKLSGKIQVPGIGELQIDHQKVDSSTGVMLERVVGWLTQSQAIGDPQDSDYEYCWVWMKGKFARAENKDQGVDHLLCADLSAHIPSGWNCLLVGSRANLTSLTEVALPSLGSSPIAIQAALDMLSDTSSQPTSTKKSIRTRSPKLNTCQRLLHATETVVSDPSTLEWSIAGIAEIAISCRKEKVLLASPLFLTYYASNP
jgi:hypothetical protein